MEAVTAVFANIFGILGGENGVVTTVTANPVMCIGLAAAVGGIAIGWFKSLTGQRRGRGRR